MRKTSGGVLLPDGISTDVAPLKRKVIGEYRWGKLSQPERDAALADGWLPPIAGGAAPTYGVWSGAQPTTAALTKVTSGTAIKTLLQVQTGSSVGLRVIEWGVSFDATLTTPAMVELIDTASIAATVTAYGAGDIVKMNNPSGAASTVVTGTSASGFAGSAEGTITSGRLGDYQLVGQAFVKQFPLGREFEVSTSHNLRIRMTSGTSVGVVAYIIWEE